MSELDAPYALTPERIAYFRENGYVRLRDVLPGDLLADYGQELTQVVRSMPVGSLPDAHLALLTDAGRRTLRDLLSRARGGNHDTYARAFTQRMNLWEVSAKVERFVRSTRLARIATELMGVAGVRLYHDQALYKEAHGGHTPWHCDQYYWPLSNPNTVTAWIPLQAVPADMGPLAFARGSHRLDDVEGRRLAISDDSEEKIGRLLADYEVDAAPFELGEVSFHSGWTFHRADPNRTDRTRGAFTIIYMDRDVRVVAPEYDAQELDRVIWMPGIEPGEVAASKINPILYERP